MSYIWTVESSTTSSSKHVIGAIGCGLDILFLIRGRKEDVVDVMKGERPEGGEAVCAGSFDKTGRYLVVSTMNKHIVLYDSSNGKIVGKPIHVPKKVMDICFAGNVIVFGDKAGRVYGVRLAHFLSERKTTSSATKEKEGNNDENDNQAKEATDDNIFFLFGHPTSIVTNVSYDAVYSTIVTSDRDEKVRITEFPKTSIVRGYCLGHSSSIEAIELIGESIAGGDTGALKSYLVSSDSSGSICVWDRAGAGTKTPIQSVKLLSTQVANAIAYSKANRVLAVLSRVTEELLLFPCTHERHLNLGSPKTISLSRGDGEEGTASSAPSSSYHDVCFLDDRYVVVTSIAPAPIRIIQLSDGRDVCMTSDRFASLRNAWSTGVDAKGASVAARNAVFGRKRKPKPHKEHGGTEEKKKKTG
eukprot:g1807.t1